MKWLSVLLLLVSCLGVVRAAQRVPATVGEPVAPQKTWVIVVGLLNFRHKEFWTGFPDENRRDLEVARSFRRLGVPPDHVLVLTDERATRREIEKRSKALLARTGRGDRLFLYYAGHGWKDERGRFYAVPYDGGQAPTLWSVDDFTRMLQKNFRGGSYIVATDCCYSGAVPNFAAGTTARIPWAALSSSSSDTTSTDRWTFTNGLIAGINGNPTLDRNGDGIITFRELTGFTKKNMDIFEDQPAQGLGSRGFDPDTPLFRVAPTLKPL